MTKAYVLGESIIKALSSSDYMLIILTSILLKIDSYINTLYGMSVR